MFKNLVIYRLAGEGLPDLAAIEDLLQKARFVPCGLTQQQSCGWVPARGVKNGPLADTVAGQLILKLQVEQRILPSAVIKRRCDEIAAKIEQETGRKPGKKQMKEVKEQATLELLPMAFTRQSATLVWIDPDRGALMVDSSSQGKADEVVSFLVKTLETVAVSQLHTQISPAAGMADWLVSGEPPASFTVDRDLELKAADEMKARVRYDRHLLDTDEVRQHITSGKVPTKLGMTWEGRVSFILSDTLQLRKLTFLDVVFEGQKALNSKDDAFDADAAIATGELAQLLPSLIDALGGEHVMEIPSETAVSAAPAAHSGDGPDPLYDQALTIVRTHGKPSISLVQRHLRIGYNRAARLLEAMEQAGAVSPMMSNGTRTVMEAA